MSVKNGKFVYEKAVRGLMKGLFGDGKSDSLAFLKNKKVDGDKVCKHTLMRMPTIKSCKVMKKLLEDLIDTNERVVLNVVGESPDVSNIQELNDKLEELDNSGKKSIVLSVNKYMTGVSMPLLDSMIYLRNANSPQDYDQSIFRLCTRNVKKVKDADEGMSKLVNMKENVYLIDFNVANMFNMMANSAKMKAAAEGSADSKRIAELMKDDLKAMPIFCEKGDDVMVKMHKMSVKDMLEIYAGYNENKSVADITNDDINLFMKLFTNKKFQDLVMGFDVDRDKSVNVVGDVEDGEDVVSVSGVKKEMDNIITYLNNKKNLTKEETKKVKETQEKFKRIVKLLMYCNLCLDEPYIDMEGLLEGAKDNKEFVDMLKSFKISVKDLKDIYEYMDTTHKQLFNSMLLKIALLMNETSKNDYEKFMSGIAGLGRIEKNEVVTPKAIVKKMIGKLDKSEFEKANSILLVNEKQGEFFVELCKMLGNEEAAKKCKIVASSEITIHLITKLLKTMKLDNYIKDIILDIEDTDGDGKYDVNDFLKLENSKILDMNNGKKFDVVLMNPPYDRGLHEKFLHKTLNISETVCSIQPANFLFGNRKNTNIINNVK